MFLWFIAVIRDQIGEREDRFFATVFFGSRLLFVAIGFGTRAGAVSLIAMATVGLKSDISPRWFGRAGYIVGVVLLVVVVFWDWIILVLPIWVALISLYILGRERSRRQTRTVPTGADR